MGADSATADPTRRIGHDDDGAGIGPIALRGLDVLRRPLPARRAVEGDRLPGGRFASRRARRAAEPDGVACAGIRYGHAVSATGVADRSPKLHSSRPSLDLSLPERSFADE